MKRGNRIARRLMVGWWIVCLAVIASGLPKLLAVRAEVFRDPVMDLPGPFPGCYAAHAAGYYNIPRNSPAYSPDQDGDDDGLACEPHRHDFE